MSRSVVVVALVSLVALGRSTAAQEQSPVDRPAGPAETPSGPDSTLRAESGPASDERVRAVRRFREAVVAQAEGRHGDAIAIYEQLRTTLPGAEVLHNLALAYRAAGQVDRALEAAEAAVRQVPSSPMAWNALGLVRDAAGLDAAAAEAWRRAAGLSDGFAAPLVNLARRAQRAGQVDEATALAERALDRDPEDARAHLVRANLAEAAADLERAARHYQAYLALAPERDRVRRRVEDHLRTHYGITPRKPTR